MTRRPFRSPHHTVSAAGAGRRRRQSHGPGEISLAHNGRAVSGRAAGVPPRTRWRRCASPWRTGRCTISRVAGHGDLSQPVHAGVRHEPLQVRLVRPPLRPLHAAREQEVRPAICSRMSGPLLDRIDTVCGGRRSVEFEELRAPGEAGALLRHRRAGRTRPGTSRTRALWSGSAILQRPDGPGRSCAGSAPWTSASAELMQGRL